MTVQFGLELELSPLQLVPFAGTVSTTLENSGCSADIDELAGQEASPVDQRSVFDGTYSSLSLIPSLFAEEDNTGVRRGGEGWLG